MWRRTWTSVAFFHVRRHASNGPAELFPMDINVAQIEACGDLAVPAEIMQHLVKVESSFNRFAIGVVGGRLERQPRTLREAVSTANALRQGGWNYSVGLAQINQSNFEAQGLGSHAVAFGICPNLRAGARILADCQARFGDWGKAFSCYYSGNPRVGFTHGYVQKIQKSMQEDARMSGVLRVVSQQLTPPLPQSQSQSRAVSSRLSMRLQPQADVSNSAPAKSDHTRVF